MSDPSGSLGASYVVAPDVTLYVNGATSFESPTTTELVNTTGNLGFNTELGPQRTLSAEMGARGRVGGILDYRVAAFGNRIHDAIIQAREVDGRAYFENAGRVRVRGIEGGLGIEPRSWISLHAGLHLRAVPASRSIGSGTAPPPTRSTATGWPACLAIFFAPRWASIPDHCGPSWSSSSRDRCTGTTRTPSWWRDGGSGSRPCG